MADRVGQQLGNYRLIRLLGQSGIAEVYLGEHLHLGTPAAIKLLHTALSSDERANFLEEVLTIAHLEHPHIVRVLDFGFEHEPPYLVMSYAPGGSLRQLYPKGTRLPLPTIVTYVNQVAHALQYAHEQKLIHRDVKPENMLMGRHNEVLLSDFGIAVIAHSTSSQKVETMAGTIPYTAPEQIQGHPRPASDQYSLGVVVYEWLCGDRPFQGTVAEVALQHAMMSPPSLRQKGIEILPEVEQVVMIALAKDPTERFRSVDGFAHALSSAAAPGISPEISTAAPPGISPEISLAAPPPRLDRFPTKAAPPPRLSRRLGLVLIPAVLLAGISTLIFKWVGGSGLLFVAQMLLLTVAICLTPTLVGLFVKSEKRVVLVTIESSLFSALLVGFGLWFFSGSVIGPWIAYAVVLIVLIEAGSHIVQWHKDTILKRLSTGPSFKSIQGDAENLEKMFRYEVILYTSVPLGLLTGTSIGLIRHETLLATILLCFQLLLLLASLVLLCFLVLGFRRMCDSIFKTAPVAAPQIAVKRSPGLLLRVFEVLVPPPLKSIPVVEDPKQKDLDLACDVSELRKIYKYDMLHNAILLVALASAAVSIWGVTIDVRWLIGLLLAATLLLSEVPYAIGQYLLHQKVLERYTGSTHAEMSKKLQEYVPLFPPLPILAALMTAGTIGGFLFFLLSLFVQGALSPPK